MSDAVFRGWKEIAGKLEVDEDTAYRYSRRNYDPLPVRYDHAERVWMYQAALGAWIHRQDLPAHAYDVLKEQRELPSKRGASATSGVSGTKVAASRRGSIRVLGQQRRQT